jgi:hypothetical protein
MATLPQLEMIAAISAILQCCALLMRPASSSFTLLEKLIF